MNVCKEARKIVEAVLIKEILNSEEVEKFQEKEYTKEVLNLNYSFLRKIDISKDISEQTKDYNGNNRYWKTVYKIGNENYVICSQWYTKDLEYLKRWVVGLDNLKEEIGKIELNKKDILEKVFKSINMKGYKYEGDELKNFYLSLKAKPFAILAGISGTGKSKLVELFAEAIGAEKNYNIISVKPDWTDSTELLGYKDIKGDFIPGILTRIIAEAKENLDKPYFVCLDEMNLARVEYYLGEYLSLIESRYRNENGEICTREIFKQGYFNKDDEYRDLYFPENLYIIGTVNMDDTTFGFSKKVLDRANTIEFSEADLEELNFLNEIEEEVENIVCTNEFMKTNFLSLKEIWTSSTADFNEEELQEYAKEVNKKIVEIQKILKRYSRHFAFRVRDEIVIYMTENKIAKLLSEDEAFDFQLMQKILPIISGSDEATREILIDLLKICFHSEIEIFKDSSLEDIIKEIEKMRSDENQSKVKYKLSIEKIVQMLRGYENGYATYWL